ncbi:MAG: enoyl-CoA hydratase/isomerase family protein [Thermoleophilia bacterium]|nr:enoyl-CoA hydratase/isomerase family protein [Thermoleophilia bacterium]
MTPAAPDLPDSILWDEDVGSGVRLVTINRPERMNAIGPVEARGLSTALARFRDDDSARVLVITGAGTEAFCAGADIGAVAAMFGEGESSVPQFEFEPGSGSPLPAEGNIGPTRWTDIHKPIIAAINGAAYAGGLEWACLAHLRIADQHASFGVTCRRWNIGLGDGGTQRLPRLIGMSRALDLIITGRVIGAPEAERIGLVNEMTRSGHCLGRALELARTIADLPQPALRTDLEAVVRGFGRPLEEGLALEAECFNRLIGDPEMLSGARRFLDREHPDRQSGSGPLYLPAKAWAFAERAHRGRPGHYGSGYFVEHPVAVAAIVAEYGDETAEAAAFLHDTVEKAETTADEIEQAFGPEMRDLVATLAQDLALENYEERKADHRRRVSEAGSRARLVYAADRVDGIERLLVRLEAGDDPDDLDAERRFRSWRIEREMLAGLAIPPELLARIDDGLGRVDAALSGA